MNCCLGSYDLKVKITKCSLYEICLETPRIKTTLRDTNLLHIENHMKQKTIQGLNKFWKCFTDNLLNVLRKKKPIFFRDLMLLNTY